MTGFAKSWLLLGPLLATVVIRGDANPPIGTAPEPPMLTLICPEGFYPVNGFCQAYSWAGPSVVTTSPGPALPPY